MALSWGRPVKPSCEARCLHLAALDGCTISSRTSAPHFLRHSQRLSINGLADVLYTGRLALEDVLAGRKLTFIGSALCPGCASNHRTFCLIVNGEASKFRSDPVKWVFLINFDDPPS